MLVDSHCHLDYKDFSEELDVVVARAKTVGISRFLTISTTLSGFPGVVAVAERYDDIYCTVGVHPHEAQAEGLDGPGPLIDAAAHPKVVGIGETGLDYHYTHSPPAAQRRNFAAHIAAARATGLPLVVHAREADAEMMATLSDAAAEGPLNGVMHCFSSGRELAELAIEIGFYISFSGILTFKSADALRALARELPEDRLLVETDAPYLAPVPHRGRRNEPAFVVETAKVLADLRGLDLETLGAVTTANFHRLFAKVAPADERGNGS